MKDLTGQTDKRFDRSLLALSAAVFLLAILFAAFLRHAVITLPFPYPVEYGEGVLTGWMQRFDAGERLYPAVSADDVPWLHNPYGPLWFLLGVLFRGVPGGVFTAARLMSLLALAAGLLFLYCLSRRELGRGHAVLICALFAASPLVWRYSLMARVDMAAIAASLGSLFLMELASERGGDAEKTAFRGRFAAPGLWFLAGAAASAAVLIKPIFIAAALAGPLVSCRRGFRLTAAFCAGFLVPVLGAAAWLWMRGEGGIAGHYLWMNRVGFSVPLMFRILLAGAGRHPFLMIAFFFGLSTVDRDSPRWWFALLMSGVFLSFGAKIGADAHYFLIILAAAAVLAAPVAGRIIREGYMHVFLCCLAAQFALYLPVEPRPVFTATYGQEVPAGHSALTPGESDFQIGRMLVGEITGAGGPVLSDDPGYLVAAGRRIAVQPFQYGRLMEAGVLDGKGLKEHIESGFFALVILRHAQPEGPSGSDFPPEIIGAVKEKYQLHREIGPYLLYVPAAGICNSKPESI